MSVSCSSFRRLVEQVLVGRPDPRRLSELGFHGHLLGCPACRGLLEGEEALEVLLASWPHPELPADLSARLIERLRENRRLEELLDLDSEPPVPAGLAERVLAGVGDAAGRIVATRTSDDEVALDQRLDNWLDAAGEVRVPIGLASRVAARLREPALGSTAYRRRLRLDRRRSVGMRAAAGFFLLATLGGLWRAMTADAEVGFVPVNRLEIAMAAPPTELLSALPVLENWDVLFADDDPELATGMDFTAEDELMIELVKSDLALEPGGDAPLAADEEDNG